MCFVEEKWSRPQRRLLINNHPPQEKKIYIEREEVFSIQMGGLHQRILDEETHAMREGSLKQTRPIPPT